MGQYRSCQSKVSSLCVLFQRLSIRDFFFATGDNFLDLSQIRFQLVMIGSPLKLLDLKTYMNLMAIRGIYQARVNNYPVFLMFIDSS